jgi:hypothetical protein
MGGKHNAHNWSEKGSSDQAGNVKFLHILLVCLRRRSKTGVMGKEGVELSPGL